MWVADRPEYNPISAKHHPLAETKILHEIRRLDSNHLWQLRASACTTHNIAESTVNTTRLKGETPTMEISLIVPMPKISKQIMLHRGGLG